MTDEPKGLYRHYKGGTYMALGFITHTETGEELVAYQCVATGKNWVRPSEMFSESVDVDGTVMPRFAKMVSRRTLGRGAGN
jgi:hypothetical protein